MGSLPTDMTLGSGPDSSPADHLAHHVALAQAFNTVKGPFPITFATADAGVLLWTPAVGDLIVGLWAEFSQGWSGAPTERIGIGPAGCANADLACLFAPSGAVPPATPTFVRGLGLGIPFGDRVERIVSSVPLYARTVTGGNTTGALNLWVRTIAASQAS